MATLVQEIQRANARGDKSQNGFKGAIRSLENVGVEVGDEFKIPEGEFKVRVQNIGGNDAEYIFVELVNEPGQVKQFYPSTFTKRRSVYNEDGTLVQPVQRVHTKGTAAELFRSFGSVEEGMKALQGKTLKVTNMEQVRTLRFGTTSLMNAQIPTIDIVEE